MRIKSNIWFLGILCTPIFLWMSCASAPELDPVPTLDFRSFSKSSLAQGEFNDSLYVELFFTDGDGDFGSESTSSQANIFFIDNRTSSVQSYKAPFIPPQGANNGVKGSIRILLRSTCCIYPPSTGIFPCESVPDFPSNSLSYTIYIMDRSGNESNKVTTPALVLQCN
jgi:hypothetical protein